MKNIIVVLLAASSTVWAYEPSAQETLKASSGVNFGESRFIGVASYPVAVKAGTAVAGNLNAGVVSSDEPSLKSPHVHGDDFNGRSVIKNASKWKHLLNAHLAPLGAMSWYFNIMTRSNNNTRDLGYTVLAWLGFFTGIGLLAVAGVAVASKVSNLAAFFSEI